MSTLILSLLLLVLIAVGMIMTIKIKETFESPNTMTVSPTLMNLVATPDLNKPRVNVDALARENDLRRSQEDEWTQEYKGRRADCASADHNKGFRVDDVSGCMRECTLNNKCNVFNYDTDASPSCFLQSCPDVNNIPLQQDGFPNSSVWYKSGGAQKSATLSPDVEKSATLSPDVEKSAPLSPDVKKSALNPQDSGGDNCPDMSQYIRLDEIPCWNCSLP